MSNVRSILPSPAEQRRDERHAVGADVAFASETQELAGTTCDVSLSGACIAAYRVLPVRTPLRVRVTLPQGVVYADAVVRWVRPGSNGGPGKFGVSWCELSELDRSLLSAFEDEEASTGTFICSRGSVLRLRAP